MRCLPPGSYKRELLSLAVEPELLGSFSGRDEEERHPKLPRRLIVLGMCSGTWVV